MKPPRTPLSQGYRMPAEWQPHAATYLAFPHHRTDFPGRLSNIPHVFAQMARVITQQEELRFLVRDGSEEQRAREIFKDAHVDLSRVRFLRVDTNRSWLRDTMPLGVTKPLGVTRVKGASAPKKSGDKTLAVNFRFDGWSRYRDHLLDDAAGRAVSRKDFSQTYEPRLTDGSRAVLEGGSIDVDDAGTLLTTEECLVTSKLARFKEGKEVAEKVLCESLGVKKVLWLNTGIAGDDTSGHVDDFARFAPRARVLLCQESRKADANYAPLRAAARALQGATDARGRKLEVVPLPMPDPIFYRGERLPASYANFYICNAAVLVPVFNDAKDAEALRVIAACYPDRPTIGIYARDLVIGLGTLHCSSMQVPA